VLILKVILSTVFISNLPVILNMPR